MEIVSSGRSLEGNEITGIHLYGSGGKGSKPAVVFHGTVHAREWIASKVRQSRPFARHRVPHVWREASLHEDLFSFLEPCAWRHRNILMETRQVIEYLAFTLLNGYQDDADIRGFVDKYDFYLFPIVNPDGKQPRSRDEDRG